VVLRRKEAYRVASWAGILGCWGALGPYLGGSCKIGRELAAVVVAAAADILGASNERRRWKILFYDRKRNGWLSWRRTTGESLWNRRRSSSRCLGRRGSRYAYVVRTKKRVVYEEELGAGGGRKGRRRC